MKTHEITTSKGVFLVVDIQNEYSDFYNITQEYGFISSIEDLSEEHAKLIVDNGIFKGFYTFEGWGESENPRLTLDCLLKSKGIDINNGNWYLFKKLK